MAVERISTKGNGLDERDDWNPGPRATALDTGFALQSAWLPSVWMPAGVTRLPYPDAPPPFDLSAKQQKDQADPPASSSTTIGEFVELRFIPEYVAIKRTAGRSYFRTILNHVLPPERVANAFAIGPEKANNKLKAIAGWPYIDSLELSQISPEMIQHLTATALEHGYSIQTATHIRNVIRIIFSHATRTGFYSGPNPANLVTLPAMTRKEAHTLSLAQLSDVLRAMRYPEREIALFTLLTEMSVAEICGLQWKYLNVSNAGRLIEGEFIPAKTIAVRKQSYRGEFGLVTESRRKFVRVPELLCSTLQTLKTRKQFTAPHDFVLVSRNGTPIHPENVAARRLKVIGQSFRMPWLSWRDFHRTHIALKSEFGRKLYEEFERILGLRN